MFNGLLPALYQLAGNAEIDMPDQWKDNNEPTAEYTLSLRSPYGSSQRQKEAKAKLKVLRTFADDPLSVLLLPLIQSLPFANAESKEQIEKEIQVIKDYWSSKLP